MRGSVKVFTLASVALLSCRGILGIEEIEEGTADGGTGTPDAAADSVGTDSATPDTGSETGADAGVCSDKTGGDCTKCCRELGKENYKELENLLKPCLCDGGCNDCQANLCAGGDPAGTQCIPCMDNAIKSGTQCTKEKNDCFAKTGCKPVYDCIAACK